MKTRYPNPVAARKKKNGKASAAKKGVEHWKERCSQLEKECDQLRGRLAEVLTQRAEYSQIICDMVGAKEVQFDEEAALAQIGQLPLLSDLIEELAGSGPVADAKKKRSAGKRAKTA